MQRFQSGEVAEWSNAPVLKTGVSKGTVSSNLTLSAKIENRNWKPKWGRAAGATQTHSRQKFPNPKGFSTLRVAQKRRFDP